MKNVFWEVEVYNFDIGKTIKHEVFDDENGYKSAKDRHESFLEEFDDMNHMILFHTKVKK